MGAYATLSDLKTLWRNISNEEAEKANALLPLVSDCLRHEAKMAGKDLDAMIAEDPSLASVAKSVTVDVAARMLLTSTSSEPMSQFSESALGYTVSGTYLVPGGGLFIKKAELARLGIRRQKIGVLNLCGSKE